MVGEVNETSFIWRLSGRLVGRSVGWVGWLVGRRDGGEGSGGGGGSGCGGVNSEGVVVKVHVTRK